MPEPEARTEDVCARLSAVGLTPDVKEYRNHTRVEARVPDSFPTSAWGEVLAVLEAADWFGLADSTARGRSLWAAISKNAPASTDATAGPDDQP